jgi:hypothetical protein
LKNENIDGRRQRMFKEDYYKELVVTSGFGVDRGSYKHEGVDYHGTKKDDVKNQIAGVVCEITLDDKYYGNHCIIKSNPKYLKGVDELFYHSYCHLFKIDAELNKFVNFGEIVGRMGNSGNCYTKFNEKGKLSDSYRHVTTEEQKDEICNYGVHLHLWFYQKCKAGEKTKLLTDLKKKSIITDKAIGDTHFYQWGKIIYAPRVIYSYFQKLL